MTAARIHRGEHGVVESASALIVVVMVAGGERAAHGIEAPRVAVAGALAARGALKVLTIGLVVPIIELGSVGVAGSCCAGVAFTAGEGLPSRALFTHQALSCIG